MPSGRDLKIILSNMKGLFIIVGAVMLIMAVLSAISGNPGATDGFFYGAVIGIGIGLLLNTVYPNSEDPELRHAMVIAAIAYLIVPAVSSVPFMVTEHMGPLDAFFESISGWTGTGFSVIAHPESTSPMTILWRSVSEWIGGLGVIVLMVTILIRPGTSTYMLYQSEARKDKILPSIRSTLNVIWGIYLILTVIAFLLLLGAGMPAWDAMNTALTAISTGGSTIYGDSVVVYHSLPIELVLIPIIIAGAVPFTVVYRMFKKDLFALLRDSQVRVFLMIIALGAAFLSIENYYYYHDITATLRYSVFQFISAITGAGLQSCDISNWSHSALLIISVGMIIGGCAGSTAGGIKVARAIFMGNEVKLWIARVLGSKNSIVAIKIGGKKVTGDVIDQEMAEASLITFLWLFSVFISVLVLSNIVGDHYDLSQVIFTVCSALGNVGMSCGIVGPGLSAIGKVLVIVNMWIGRLEIIPMIVLLRYAFKGFRS